MLTELHEQRLQQVVDLLKAADAKRVADLGCGSGTLLGLLQNTGQFEQLIGVEPSSEGLARARFNLLENNLPSNNRPSKTVSSKHADLAANLELLNGSCLDRLPILRDLDALLLVEVMEHIPPNRLQQMEENIFAWCHPAQVILTTPNGDYNPSYGLASGEYRDPDHHFEWGRARFRRWAFSVASRQGYAVRISGIGEADSELGYSSHLAVFTRKTDTRKTDNQETANV